MWAVVGGGDDKKKDPVADKSQDPKPTGSAPVDPGDGSGDGRDGKEDLNAGRQVGESKVLWYKTAPKAPGDGADAPGMWVTDTLAAKAVYNELVAYNISDGRPSWPTIKLPQKICGASVQKSDDDKVAIAYMSGVTDRAKCNQVQQIDLKTGKKDWEKKIPEGDLFDGTGTGVELTYAGSTLMVGRQMSGLGLSVSDGKQLFEKKKYGAACFPGAFMRRRAPPGRLLLRCLHGQGARRDPGAGPGNGQGEVDQAVPQGLEGRPRLLRLAGRPLPHQRGQEAVEHHHAEERQQRGAFRGLGRRGLRPRVRLGHPRP